MDFSYFHCGPFVSAASHSETPLVKREENNSYICIYGQANK